MVLEVQKYGIMESEKSYTSIVVFKNEIEKKTQNYFNKFLFFLDSYYFKTRNFRGMKFWRHFNFAVFRTIFELRNILSSGFTLNTSSHGIFICRFDQNTVTCDILVSCWC